MRNIIIIAAIVLASCSSKNHFKLPSGELELSIMGDSGITSTCIISANSDTFIKIQSWLTNNQSDWHKSPASYLPKKIITGNDFKAQILKNSIVINDLWVHAINDSFYGSITCE